MGISAFLSYGGLRSYVFLTIDLVGQWRGYDGVSEETLASKFFKLAKDYTQLIDAFESCATFEVRWIKKPVKAAAVFTWLYAVCEGINYLKLRNIVHLSPERGARALGWCTAITGVLSCLLYVKELYDVYQESPVVSKASAHKPAVNEPLMEEDSVQQIFKPQVHEHLLSKIQFIINLNMGSIGILNFACVILNSPLCEKYDLKNAKLYVNTGLVIAIWADFLMESYVKWAEEDKEETPRA